LPHGDVTIPAAALTFKGEIDVAQLG